jgi:hypothetical protein
MGFIYIYFMLPLVHTVRLGQAPDRISRERGFHKTVVSAEDRFRSILAALWHKLVNPVLLFLGYTVSTFNLSLLVFVEIST